MLDKWQHLMKSAREETHNSRRLTRFEMEAGRSGRKLPDSPRCVSDGGSVSITLGSSKPFQPISLRSDRK